MAHRRRQRAPREFREVELDLAGLSHLGGAVGRLDEMVYFVAYGLPGERVVAQVALRHSVRTGQSLVTPRVPDASLETGQRYLEDEVLGRRFRISANSFFQVNTRPARRAPPGIIAAPWIGAREADWSQADI